MVIDILCWKFHDFLIESTLFIKNKALGNAGGGVMINDAINAIHLLNSAFTGNIANEGGGIIKNQGGLNISNCHFENNTATVAGGAMLVRNLKEVEYPLLILNSQFTTNAAVVNGGHISIYYQFQIHKTLVYIDRCVFENGTAQKGGAISVERAADGYMFYYPYCSVFLLSNTIYSRNHASQYGGAAHINISMLPQNAAYSESFVHTSIENCTMINNYAKYGAGLSFIAASSGSYQPCAVSSGCLNTTIVLHFSSSQILNNRADSVSAIYINVAAILQEYIYSNISITQTAFFNNTPHRLHYASAVIQFNNVSALISSCNFINNKGSSIVANQSVITLHGHVNFTYNRAYAGAALLLDCPQDSRLASFLTLLPDTTVNITNNVALHYGGGIAVNPMCDYTSSCFFQAPSMANAVVYFEDNTAYGAGNSLYGPPINSCGTLVERQGEINAFKAIFLMKSGYLYGEIVLGLPYSICFCDEDFELSCSTQHEVSTWVGEEFSVAVISTGGISDPSRSFIRASLMGGEGFDGQLGNSRLQEIQRLKHACDTLTYSIITTATIAQIMLQIDSVPDVPPSFISIIVNPCPLGFKFDKDQLRCVCNEFLTEQIPDIICTIENGEITVPGSVWIGNYSDKLAAHRHCPLDYCNPDTHSVDLQQQHLQCTHNRSGVLCEACHTGFILSLRTIQCLKNCSNYYLFLIIQFTLQS